MRFSDREEAAALLVERLAKFKGQHPLVLGVPRGAVPMARIIADALDGDLDVVLVRKLGAPGQRELAIGAVDETGTVLAGDYIDIADEAYLRDEIDEQMKVLQARRELYTRTQTPIDPAGRICIIVDDGIATGSSMLAAIHSLRARRAKTVVVAVGVAPPQALARISAAADEIVCLQAPTGFYAVGQFFADFSEVTDDMVVAALSRPPLEARGCPPRTPTTPWK